MSKTKEPQTRLDDLEKRLDAAERFVQEQKTAAGQMVIFSAKLDGNETVGPFDKEQIVIFNTVITNINNGYNSATGIFAAPVAGVYHFSMFYHAGGNKNSSLLLYKNKDIVVKAFGQSSKDKDSDNGGNAVHLELKQGDQVYVCLAPKTHVWGSNDVTTFSGRLVHLLS